MKFCGSPLKGSGLRCLALRPIARVWRGADRRPPVAARRSAGAPGGILRGDLRGDQQARRQPDHLQSRVSRRRAGACSTGAWSPKPNCRPARSEAGRKGADVANRERQKSGKGVGKQGGKVGGKRGGKIAGCGSTVTAGQETNISRPADGGSQQNAGNAAGKTTPSSFFSLSSVSKDTGAEAPIDKGKVTFGACLAYLVESGRNADSARNLLGMWRRDHGDDAVQAAVDKARAGDVSNPVSYIEACLRRAARASSTPGRPASLFEAQP